MINPPHICGFLNSHDDEFRVVIPFILEGLEKGEKAFHTVDPGRRDPNLRISPGAPRCMNPAGAITPEVHVSIAGD
jgi:hypothetical protein